MAAALIGSLLGLGTQGLALGINQVQRNSQINKVRNQASAIPGQRAEMRRSMSAQLNSARTNNPALERRNAMNQLSQSELGFSQQRMQEDREKSRMVNQLQMQKDSALQSGLVGLGAGLAGGAASLATTGGDKKTPEMGAGTKEDAQAKQAALGGSALGQLMGFTSPAATPETAAGLSAPGSAGLAAPPTTGAPVPSPLPAVPYAPGTAEIGGGLGEWPGTQPGAVGFPATEGQPGMSPEERAEMQRRHLLRLSFGAR